MRYTHPCVNYMTNHRPTQNRPKQVYCTFHEGKGHRYHGHPESPQRVQTMRYWVETPPYPEMKWLKYSTADEASICLVHSQELLITLQEACQRGPHEFEPSPSYVTQHSYQAALGAVGATLAVSRRIIDDGKGHGFAIVRPPGHHAEPDRSMGFCLFNNVAIAAADALSRGLDKVAVLDIDAHHGNGTEAAFWDREEAGFLSIHEGNIYPGTGFAESAPHARGRIVNIPLPPSCGNEVYQSILTDLVAPWLCAFKPAMLFVSVGYDAHFTDSLANLILDTTGYHELSKLLVHLAETFCHGRLMFVLEGGYNAVALKDNVQACLAALCRQDSFPDHYGQAPISQVRLNSLVDNIIDLHALRRIENC